MDGHRGIGGSSNPRADDGQPPTRPSNRRRLVSHGDVELWYCNENCESPKFRGRQIDQESERYAAEGDHAGAMPLRDGSRNPVHHFRLRSQNHDQRDREDAEERRESDDASIVPRAADLIPGHSPTSGWPSNNIDPLPRLSAGTVRLSHCIAASSTRHGCRVRTASRTCCTGTRKCLLRYADEPGAGRTVVRWAAAAGYAWVVSTLLLPRHCGDIIDYDTPPATALHIVDEDCHLVTQVRVA